MAIEGHHREGVIGLGATIERASLSWEPPSRDDDPSGKALLLHIAEKLLDELVSNLKSWHDPSYAKLL